MYIDENFEDPKYQASSMHFYQNAEALADESFEIKQSETKDFFEAEANEKAFFRCKTEMSVCPFCRGENPTQIVCVSCGAMLMLSDLEVLLAHSVSEREILRQAVERMELEKNLEEFSVDELKILAIGQINIKNFRQGFVYLSKASQIEPNNVVLASQVNTLAIRVSEIERQQSIHDSIPKGRTILIVDDSETVRSLLSSRLEKSGHRVLCAVNGIQALETIKENTPDLIFLDASLPQTDGYQVCKLIRSNFSTKDVPVVMISEKDGFFDKIRGHLAGTTGYIIKPFGPERLMRTVETYIS